MYKKINTLEKHVNDMKQFNEASSVNIISVESVQASYYGDYDEPCRVNMRQEIALWRAVLWQNISDAKSISKKTEIQKAKKDAIDFFINIKSQKHAIALCRLCGYSYKAILKYLGLEEKRDSN